MNPTHDFLITESVGMSPAALQMSTFRQRLVELPKQQGTYKLSDLDGITYQSFDDIHVEFAKSWPLSRAFSGANRRGQRYVNPHYIHANRYSDISVTCDCGTTIRRNYEHADSSLESEHNHTESCMPFDRLRARASIQEKRHEAIYRLSWLGWRGHQMAPRFGAESNGIGGMAAKFGTTLKTVYEKFRIAAANTYTKLNQKYGVPQSKIADCYGYSVSTMTRWAKKYSNYDTDRGENQFSLVDNRQFSFVQANNQGSYRLTRTPRIDRELEYAPESVLTNAVLNAHSVRDALNNANAMKETITIDETDWMTATKRPITLQYAGPFTEARIVESAAGTLEIDQAYVDEHDAYYLVRGSSDGVHPEPKADFEHNHNLIEHEVIT